MILHIQAPVAANDAPWLDCAQDHATLPVVRRLLVEAKPDHLGIARVPNGRVLAAVRATQLAATAQPAETVGDLRAASALAAEEGVDPEAFWSLADDLGYRVAESWLSSGGEGRFDVFLTRAAPEAADASTQRAIFPVREAAPAARHRRATNPLQRTFARRLAPRLREHLSERLPEYMAPAAYVALDALPLSPNGKLDRRALPAPEAERLGDGPDFVPPRTAVERLLASIWSDLLGVGEIGVNDDFFALGGHSLLATQVISQLREALHLEVPLRRIFEARTLARLAEAVLLASSQPAAVERAAEVWLSVADLSDDQIEAMLAERASTKKGPSQL